MNMVVNEEETSLAYRVINKGLLELNPYEFTVYCAMACGPSVNVLDQNIEGEPVVEVSYNEIARDTTLATNTVAKAVKSLQVMGAIELLQAGKGRNHPSTYSIKLYGWR